MIGAAEDNKTNLLFLTFGALMLPIGSAGSVVAKTASELIAAVRRGALQLAVGGIIGGNTFDTLFLMASDVSYREGSLYHAVGDQDYSWIVSALLMTGILIGGLILRQRQGPAQIGAESILLLVIYAGAVAVQFAAGA